jgi:hypothetical protein
MKQHGAQVLVLIFNNSHQLILLTIVEYNSILQLHFHFMHAFLAFKKSTLCTFLQHLFQFIFKLLVNIVGILQQKQLKQKNEILYFILLHDFICF